MTDASISLPTYASPEAAKAALTLRYANWMQTSVRDCAANGPQKPDHALRLIPAWHPPLLDPADTATLISVINRQFGADADNAKPLSPEEITKLAIGPAWEIHRHLPGKTAASDFIEQAGTLLLDTPESKLWYQTTGLFKLTEHDDAEINTYTHFPILQLALRAFVVTQNEALLHIADRYGERWADALLNSDELPLAINARGPKLELEGAPPVSEERARVRLLIEKGATDAFQHLYALTASPIYLIATRKLLDIAASDLRNPGSAYAVAAIQRYANDFDDGYFDEYVRIAAASVNFESGDTLHQIGTGQTPVSATALQIRDLPAPAPALLSFYGRLSRKPNNEKHAAELTAGAFDLLEQQKTSPLIVADLLRSSLCNHGAGWGKDLIDTACPYGLALTDH